ncbi:unnamed protein product [Chrysoparadoxa australica]
MDFVYSPGAVALAVLSTVAALGLSGSNIIRHIKHYNSPRTQKYIFRILAVVPVFAVGSCVSVMWPSAAVVILTIRDVYEAFVVYSFLTLILEYAGGDYNCIEQMKNLTPVTGPPPLCCWHFRRDGKLLRVCKQGCIVFVVIKPIMAACSLVALGQGAFYQPPFQWTLLIVYNISYTVALYCLLIFYLATRPLITNFKPVRKFFAVKSIVFATYWQSVLVYFVPGLTSEQAYLWNDFILCLEMIPFALLLNNAFPYHEFVTGISDKIALENVKEMLSVRDVIQDAYHNFMPSYQDYVVARDDHDKQPKTIRTRTYLVGNISKPEVMKSPATLSSSEEMSPTASSADPEAQVPRGGRAGHRRGSSTQSYASTRFHQEDEEDWSADVDIIELANMGKKTSANP